MQSPLHQLTDGELCRLCASSSQAMEELVRRYQQLVRACARPYFLAGADFDDLLQEGMLGLLHAAAAYDPDFGGPCGGLPETPRFERFRVPVCLLFGCSQ